VTSQVETRTRTRHFIRRLWLLAAATAITGSIAGTLALAPDSTRNHARAKPPATSDLAVDETRPIGPSDPPGLVGVHVPNAFRE
jgi:hypothetical protein